jgi:signal transduction histidine kinase
MPESKLKGSIAESIESIEKNITYINKIVADLQDYAKPLKPEFYETNLLELVTGVFAPITIPENINPQIEVNKELTLKSDPLLLRRILTNLIINAIQAMPDGGQLTIDAAKDCGVTRLFVEDTGVGIPEAVKPKLFTPMVTTKAKGQGLGLAVVKRLVEALNGQVTFESQEGKGTKFVITVPESP